MNSKEDMIKALGLLKLLAQGEQDIINKDTQTQEDFFADMDRSLGIEEHPTN